MAVNTDAIGTEIESVRGSFDVSWDDFAIYCKAKIIECTINGGITSYTINGRSITKDITWFEKAYDLAKREANIEASGGVSGQPIHFSPRC